MSGTNLPRVILPDTLNSVEAIHTFLKEALDFPDYYGRTLDGLWDCLGDLDQPVWIVWPHRWQTENIWFVQRSYKLLGVLMEAAEEFDNVHLEIAGENLSSE